MGLDLDKINEAFRPKAAQELLVWAFSQFKQIAFACSFGAEDVVIYDMLVRINPKARIFYLDTDLFFPETYELIERMKRRYRNEKYVIRCRPFLSLKEQESRYGKELWKRNPDLCCYLRKVLPLKHFLSKLEAWITGIRREQGPTRAKANLVEYDPKFGLIKINPLAYWSWQDVWNYIYHYKVPFNPLHQKGYPSIGCKPGTKPVKPGEDLRSGRWPGFDKTECGLHG